MTTCEPSDFQSVINSSVNSRTAKKGLKEAARTIAQGHAEVVFLATDVNEKEFINLIENLCKEQKTALINVDSKEILGQWCGLSKIDDEGEVVRARACGVVAIKKIPSTEAGEKLKAFIGQSSIKQEA